MSTTGPLCELHVLDISQGIAGPFAAKLLADLGADVLKVEPPTGEISRTWGPFPDDEQGVNASGTFIYANTGKRSVCLDLASGRGRTLVRELVGSHDIVIASATEPELAELDLGYAALSAANPEVILTTVTGFGSTGPYAGFASSHLINCAMGGWANTCGLADREPLQAGGNVTEFIAGAYAAVATLLAQQQRARDGCGQHVDVSAMEATITAALLPTMVYEYAGALPERKSSRATGPSWMMECADGYVGANSLTQAQWESMCHFLGMPELLEEPAYRTPAERLERSDELHARLAPWFRQRSAAEVFSEAQLWRIPFGLVPSLTEVLSLEQIVDRSFFTPIPFGERHRNVLVPGAPFRMPASPSSPQAAPALGDATQDILSGLLGLSAKEIEELHCDGVC